MDERDRARRDRPAGATKDRLIGKGYAMPGVLDGVRVLDFGRYIAGPYCASLLAEHGAEVIRIEKRDGSEDRHQVPLPGAEVGGLFLQMNRNKRGMTLDPMTEAGREI